MNGVSKLNGQLQEPKEQVVSAAQLGGLAEDDKVGDDKARLFGNQQRMHKSDGGAMLGKRISLEDDLPDEVGQVGYSVVPISDFGQKLFETMKQNDRAGHQGNRPLKPIQFMPRPEGLGLGAIPKKEILDKIKNGQEITNKDLRSRAFKNKSYLDGEESEDENEIRFGDKVLITKGKYADLEGLVLEVDPEDDMYINIQLKLNNKNVKILGSTLEKIRSTQQSLKPSVAQTKREDELEKKEKKVKNLKWILPNITLRIVSKEYKAGKYFEELGEVNDIMDAKTFSFVTRKGDILEDLKENDMETVMPKIDGKVLILKGEHRGVTGTLKERNKKENSVLIKIEVNDLKFIKMTQDDCSALAPHH